MKPTREQLQSTLGQQLYEELLKNYRDFVNMTSSPGYALWVKWANATEVVLEKNAANAETLEEREENRHQMLALRKMKTLPLVLSALLTSLNSTDPAAGDNPWTDSPPEGPPSSRTPGPGEAQEG